MSGVTTYDDDGQVYERPSITVYPLKQNKRPIGFAPWPKPERKQRKPRAKKKDRP